MYVAVDGNGIDGLTLHTYFYIHIYIIWCFYVVNIKSRKHLSDTQR